ncbi:MAG: hypothetical protein COB66_03600 [Coxiella sp. (in: Bacteria)]|nr:MAG: hypothetical protein COB66_03600 [Coxiella sp. (in: g-proteobacteria)]
MTSLKETQQAISGFVREQTDASHLVVAPDNMPAVGRLQVYRSAYYLRLIEALEDDYPRLAERMGRREFGGLVHDYLEVFPSNSYSLRDLGRHMPVFMSKHGDYPSELVALAEFEWAMVEVLFVADESLLTREALSLLAPEQWLTISFNLIQGQVVLVLTKSLALCIDEDADISVALLVWRKHNEAYYQALNAFDAQLLRCFSAGLDFATTCEKMATDSTEAQVIADMSQAIQYWVDQEIFKAVDIS